VAYPSAKETTNSYKAISRATSRNWASRLPRYQSSSAAGKSPSLMDAVLSFKFPTRQRASRLTNLGVNEPGKSVLTCGETNHWKTQNQNPLDRSSKKEGVAQTSYALKLLTKAKDKLTIA